MTVDDCLQWAGTGFILVMYVIMSFFPDLHPMNILAGLLGACCFLAWSLRVRNRPQQLINAVAITVCCGGLLRYFG